MPPLGGVPAHDVSLSVGVRTGGFILCGVVMRLCFGCGRRNNGHEGGVVEFVDVAVVFPYSAKRTEFPPVFFEDARVCLVRHHLGFTKGHAHEDGGVSVLPGFPFSGVWVYEGFFGFESGNKLHHDFCV